MSNKVHVLTYASHSQGYYENLINNEYNIKLITLGYGVKWNGLRDKPRAVLNYLTYVPDDSARAPIGKITSAYCLMLSLAYGVIAITVAFCKALEISFPYLLSCTGSVLNKINTFFSYEFIDIIKFKKSLQL